MIGDLDRTLPVPLKHACKRMKHVFIPGTLATLGAFIVTFVDDLDLDVDGG